MIKNDNYVDIGSFERDPFISGEWQGIVDNVKQQFPDIDLIYFKMPSYIGLASISETLDPMNLAGSMIQEGIFVMGSNKKVNIITTKEMKEIISHFV